MQRRRWVLSGVVVLLLLGLGAWIALPRKQKEPQGPGGRPGQAQGQGRGPGPGGGPGGPDRIVSVVAATASRKDVPIYLEGLGSVAAFNTVQVKPQVDGRIERIAFKEGQEVRKGDLIAQIDPRPFEILLRQSEAALARDEAQLRNGQLNLDRMSSLRERTLVSQQQVDDQRTIVAQLEATVRLDRAQADTAKLQLNYTHIVAPIDGRTGIRQIDVGNLIHQNDANPLVTIAQLDPIVVFFTLPEDNIGEVGRHMSEGPLTVEAFSRDGKTVLGRGRVALIDNQINQSTGTIRIKAVFDNPKRALWPNQFVKARLLLTTRRDVLVVPASAIQRGPQGTFVFLISREQKAELRPVEVDASVGDLALIASGVAPGEQVVADGQYHLAPGARVSVKTDAADPISGGGPAARAIDAQQAGTASRASAGSLGPSGGGR